MTDPHQQADAQHPADPSEVEEAYDGPARLLVDGRELAVHATLSGRFEPISGTYQWAGRLRPSDDLRAAVQQGRSVRLETRPGHAAAATMREEDPWGGFRIGGTGRPPFAVPTEIA
jgi:hypothetical protein